jgi:hypothetical protein
MSDVTNVEDTGGDSLASDAGAQADALDNLADAGQVADAGSGDNSSGSAGLISDDTSDPAPAPANWPEDWRSKFAGEDEKLLKRLDRFSSPEMVMKSWLDMEKKLSSGQIKKALPEDATAEEIEVWRKENGLPMKPEEYDFSELPDGYMLSDADEPLVNSFKEFAFTKNMDPKMAKDAVAWFAQASDAEMASRIEADKAYKTEAIEELRAEWGPEYRANVSLTTGALQRVFGEELGMDVANARLPDGTILGNNPGAMKRLADFGREALPGASLMPAGTADVAKGVDAEIASIEKDMKEDYHSYTRDTAKQARLLELYKAREARQAR